MKSIPAFLRLIRLPNLIFITLTQVLFYACIVYPLHRERYSLFFIQSSHIITFTLLVASSVLIAAAGYIINDYFDMHIDSVNKPDKVVVDKQVKRRWAIMWHLVLSATGIICSAYVSYNTGQWLILPANIACVALLWFYSTTFKKKLLAGNIIIAALTAWVIVVVYIFAGASLLDIQGWQQETYAFNIRKLFKITMLYAGFAFVVSLIREVIKDMEDMYGDARYDCHTMPIAWGVPAAKVFTAVWLVVCLAALVIVQVYAWQSGWWISAGYSILLIILPMVFILKKLYQAKLPVDYHAISSWVKWVMLAGILSMIFFRLL